MRFIYYPLMAVLLALASVGFISALSSVRACMNGYQWLIYGAIAYFVFRRFKFVSNNEKWLQTTTHELTHAIVGMLFLHKIHSLQADEESGVVYHSGENFGAIFISLAPYCLPIYTYILMLFRLLGASEMLYIFDLFIGISLSFHINCFRKQTRLDQPDIQGQGYVRAFMFIVCAWLFNASIILLSVKMGILKAFSHLLYGYWKDIVYVWSLIF